MIDDQEILIEGRKFIADCGTTFRPIKFPVTDPMGLFDTNLEPDHLQEGYTLWNLLSLT